MTCIECEKVKTKKHLIYEDEVVTAVLSDKPAIAGHIEVIPKQHIPILEQIPDTIVGHMFTIANRIAMVCFETLGAQGTNIIIRNGISAGQKTPHTKIHVIPRQENDGLNLQWQASKADEEELSTTELMLKTELERPKEEKPAEPKPKEETISEESYLAKQLERPAD